MENIEYDRYGRMFYNPEYHKKNGLKWSEEDIKYLIDWYDAIGPEEMSFALERTSKTVQNKVVELRKKGVMRKPIKQTYSRRLINEAV